MPSHIGKRPPETEKCFPTSGNDFRKQKNAFPHRETIFGNGTWVSHIGKPLCLGRLIKFETYEGFFIRQKGKTDHCHGGFPFVFSL